MGGLQRASDAAKRSRHENCPTPAVNQRWRDMDTRAGLLREVVVLELGTVRKRIYDRKSRSSELVEITRAHCEIYIDGVKQARKTNIDCARMVPTSTGYTYVGEGPPPQMPGSGGSK